jgi:hypothetical protein
MIAKSELQKKVSDLQQLNTELTKQINSLQNADAKTAEMLTVIL